MNIAALRISRTIRGPLRPRTLLKTSTITSLIRVQSTMTDTPAPKRRSSEYYTRIRHPRRHYTHVLIRSRQSRHLVRDLNELLWLAGWLAGCTQASTDLSV